MVPTFVRFLVVLSTAAMSGLDSANAELAILSSGDSGEAGRMRIRSDEFGSLSGSGCGSGLATFKHDENASSRNWLCAQSLFLTDGTDIRSIADERHWRHPGPLEGANHDLVGPLSGDDVLSDIVNDDMTARASKFVIDTFNLEVDLVQETPTSGYNFVQSYTLTNKGEEPVSLKAVLFNDADIEFGQQFSENRVGFTTGAVPRMYFITESEMIGEGNPGVDPRHRRISVAASMGESVTFDGFIGVKPVDFSGAGDFDHFLLANHGIPEANLNTIQGLITFNVDSQEDNNVALTGDPLDGDANCLIDSQGDVAGAMQFAINIPAGGSTSLTFDYIGGDLNNSHIDLGANLAACDARPVAPSTLSLLEAAIHAGEHNVEFDFTGDGLVNTDDLFEYVTSPDHLNTYIGDANLDGEFNSSDFIAVFVPGEYEDDIPGNSNWRSGDWNADGEADSGDFVLAFIEGGYEIGPRTVVNTVPEPNGFFLSLLSLSTLFLRRRGNSTV